MYCVVAMNAWTKKSISLANSAGYLDKLSKVYVMNNNPLRPLTKERKEAIKAAFNKKDTRTLIHLLIEGDVFPIKDSYIGFLRQKTEAIDENPSTVERIGQRLYDMGLTSLLRETSRPKETNRQLGNAFKKHLSQIYPALPESEFEKANVVAILAGTDKTLAAYARKKFNSNLTKGIDFVLKKNDQYVLGEAKFLTTPGGEQNGGFADASNFITGAHEDNVKRVALLDGYIWLKSEGGLYGKIVESNLDIFSALLLPDYIKSLQRF